MYTSALITGVANLALFGVVLLIRRRVHKEGLSAFGLGGDARSWWLLLQGSIAGTVAFLAYPAAVVLLGFGALAVAWQQLRSTILVLVFWGFAYAGVALFEEALFRGYLLLRTGSLMPAVGFHAMWDLVETILLLDAAEGVETTWNLHTREGVWTGTPSTPEAGLLVSLVVVALGAFIVLIPPRLQAEPRDHMDDRPTIG